MKTEHIHLTDGFCFTCGCIVGPNKENMKTEQNQEWTVREQIGKFILFMVDVGVPMVDEIKAMSVATTHNSALATEREKRRQLCVQALEDVEKLNTSHDVLEQQLLQAQAAISEAMLTLSATLPDEESDLPASKAEVRGCIIGALRLLKAIDQTALREHDKEVCKPLVNLIIAIRTWAKANGHKEIERLCSESVSP